MLVLVWLVVLECRLRLSLMRDVRLLLNSRLRLRLELQLQLQLMLILVLSYRVVFGCSLA
jgi:hypothetical protein